MYGVSTWGVHTVPIKLTVVIHATCPWWSILMIQAVGHSMMVHVIIQYDIIEYTIAAAIFDCTVIDDNRYLIGVMIFS